jgi:hypothetical protein
MSEICIKKHLSLLGMKVRDRVIGFEGVVSSLSFDLYGCVQAVVSPVVDKEGKPREALWFDVARLDVISSEPVMEQPNFESGKQAEGKQGPAHKPTRINY